MALCKVRPMKRAAGGKSVPSSDWTKPAKRVRSDDDLNNGRPITAGGPSKRTLGTVLRSLFTRPASIEVSKACEQRQPADTRRWTFEWPTEVLVRRATLPLDQFAAWLREHGRRELTRRQLVSQYWEWIELTETRPASWPAFDRSLRNAGIQKVRLTRGTREYRYRLAPARPKLVASTEARDQAMGDRRSVA